MLLKKGSVSVVILATIFALSGCGKKGEETQGETAEPAKAEVNLEEMVLVPAGDFIMGTNVKGPDNKETVSFPEHKVNLPAFWIDKYEVTNYQMLDFAIKESYTGEGAKEGKDWRILATPDKALFPVQYITLNDAKAYCKSVGKRLPTEEEWEKAARGSNGNAYPWGNEWEDGRSNTAETNLLKPAAVGQFNDVSPYGAHDMLGNVREWTSTPFEMYPGNPTKNLWKGRFVVRGLSPNHRGKVAHLWDRDAYPAAFLGDVGFRCAKDATPEDVAKASRAK
jgi:formylglycine-generating enzyme required for sulfatase activity